MVAGLPEAVTRVLRRRGREREGLVQAAKAAAAAALALLLLRWTGEAGRAQAFLAPYAAVLAVTTTVRRSWSGAARQAGMVLVGVLLAGVVGRLVPEQVVAVPLVVLAGLLAGRWRHFGEDGYWVAVTALLLLVNGSAEQPDGLVAWVLFSAAGSVLGATVNTLVLPPVHLQDARAAVDALAGEIGGLLREMAAGVRDGRDTAEAERWVGRARATRVTVRQAHDAAWEGRDSMRWNPRRRRIGKVDSPLAAPETVLRLDRVAERAVQVAVLLADPADGPEHPPDGALADLVERLADSVDALRAPDPSVDEQGGGSGGGTGAGTGERPRERVEDVASHVRAACVMTLSDALDDLHR
ncbi:FUSC family protein [Pseudonocardia oceani]|uniref:Aromatic acid exporter family member 1 n=5 Tax=Pseudonocardia oceani TaxID=2792013 RepID=A0ABS6UHW1_9PSEU|nr:hypothetical protein [Pseudonocardia oceani]MBW0123079.1 hypothetical protein [Pseudonocardia oceani]MBW0131842.1 hypothetical protein [Pseudonocardia oceani]